MPAPELEIRGRLTAGGHRADVRLTFRPEDCAWPPDVLADPEALLGAVLDMYREDPLALLELGSDYAVTITGRLTGR